MDLEKFEFLNKQLDYVTLVKDLKISYKGQMISKRLFGVFNFFQKTNKNTSHSSKNEFIRLFFGRIHGLTVDNLLSKLTDL